MNSKASATRTIACAITILGLMATGKVEAQDFGGGGTELGWSGRLGIGLTTSPEMFSINGEVPYTFHPLVSAGPRMQVAFSDDHTWIAPTLDVYLHPRLSERLNPYLNLGVGFAYLEKDHRPGDDEDVGFLLSAGLGIEYALRGDFFVGSSALINFLQNKTVGESTIYSWQVIQFRQVF